MHGDAVGDLAIAIVEYYLPGMHTLHGITHMACGVWHTQYVMTHARPGGIGHFGYLEVQGGTGKGSQPTRMIIMQVRYYDCADVSHQLSALLDVEDPIGSEYCLEVSSPGLERPLFTETQFAQQVNQTVSVKLRQAMETDAGSRKNFKGELTSVDNGMLEIKIDGQLFGLRIADIEQAKLLYRFK